MNPREARMQAKRYREALAEQSRVSALRMVPYQNQEFIAEEEHQEAIDEYARNYRQELARRDADQLRLANRERFLNRQGVDEFDPEDFGFDPENREALVLYQEQEERFPADLRDYKMSIDRILDVLESIVSADMHATLKAALGGKTGRQLAYEVADKMKNLVVSKIMKLYDMSVHGTLMSAQILAIVAVMATVERKVRLLPGKMKMIFTRLLAAFGIDAGSSFPIQLILQICAAQICIIAAVSYVKQSQSNRAAAVQAAVYQRDIHKQGDFFRGLHDRLLAQHTSEFSTKMQGLGLTETNENELLFADRKPGLLGVVANLFKRLDASHGFSMLVGVAATAAVMADNAHTAPAAHMFSGGGREDSYIRDHRRELERLSDTLWVQSATRLHKEK